MTDFPPGFVLRQATAADLAAFAEFSRRTFVATYGPLQTPDRMARHVADRFSDQRLREELADPARTVLVLLRGDAWAGYGMLRSGGSSPHVAAARPVEIERFYVGQEWHGQGIAAPLMAAALDRAKLAGHGAAWLSVWERNPRAVRFYEKQGFRIVGRLVYVFDGVPEDDHLMAIVL